MWVFFFFFTFFTPTPTLAFFKFYIFWPSDRSLLLFLLETSELVLDGQRRFLRLWCLQVNVNFLLLLLRFRCRGLLWRDWGWGDKS